MDRTSRITTIIIRILVLLYITVIGVYSFWSYQNDIKLAEEYYRENGGQTTATVTEAYNYKVKKRNRGAHAGSYKENYSDFTIEYAVDGKDYVSNYYDYKGTYKKGDTLTVYYLNSNPGGEVKFSLKPSLRNVIWGAVAMVVAVILLIDIFRAIHKLKAIPKNLRR